jgi:hypothetical protein
VGRFRRRAKITGDGFAGVSAASFAARGSAYLIGRVVLSLVSEAPCRASESSPRFRIKKYTAPLLFVLAGHPIPITNGGIMISLSARTQRKLADRSMDAARVPGRCHSELPSPSPDGGGAVSAVSQDVRHLQKRCARRHRATGATPPPDRRCGGRPGHECATSCGAVCRRRALEPAAGLCTGRLRHCIVRVVTRPVHVRFAVLRDVASVTGLAGQWLMIPWLLAFFQPASRLLSRGPGSSAAAGPNAGRMTIPVP